jgi:hypothetical protein
MPVFSLCTFYKVKSNIHLMNSRKSRTDTGKSRKFPEAWIALQNSVSGTQIHFEN